MAISSQTTTVSYTGSASTVTPYPVTFRYDEAAWVTVQEIDLAGAVTTLALGSDYTLTGNGSTTTGNVVTGGGAIPATSTLRISRDTAITQNVSLAVNGTIPSAVLEAEFDKLTMAALDQKRRQAAGDARSLRVPDGELAAELPAATLRAGEVLFFNASTGAVETKTPAEILALSGGAPDGIGIPAGGTTGQALVKTSATDYLVEWGDATPTAATVQAALAADPEGAWDAIEAGADILGSIDSINTQPNSVAKTALWSTQHAAPVRLALFGDSYASGFTVGPKMADAGAFNAGFVTSSGTAATNNANGSGNPKTYDYWLNGVVTSIPASSEGTFCNGDLSPLYRPGNRWSMYYLKGPTFATSFDLEWESSNNPGVWTLFTVVTNGIDGDNVSAANASVIGAVFTANLGETSTPAYKVRVKNIVGGPLVFISAGIYYSSGGGTILMGGFSDGGVDLTSVITTPAAVYEPILRDMAVDCFISCWADGAAEWETGGAFRTFITNLAAANVFTAGTGVTNSTTAITYASNTNVRQGMFVSGTGIPEGARVASITSATACVLNVAATASASGLTFTFQTKPDWITVSANPALVETGRAETRAAQRAWSIANAQTYINGQAMFRDYATGLANGLCSSDGTHLTANGAAFRNQLVWSKLPLGQIYLGAERGNGGVAISQSLGLSQLTSQSTEFPRGVFSSGSQSAYYWSDQTYPQSGTLKWSATVVTNLWQIKKGTSTYLTVSGASDGTAGVRPGFNGMDLGNDATRWRGFFHNTNITGTLIRVPDTLSGAGAIPITTPTTAYTSTGAAQALTLANGTHGQVKTIVHDVDGGSGVLTPTTKTGFTTVTFNNAGDTVTLQYFTTRGWMVIGSFGAVIA